MNTIFQPGEILIDYFKLINRLCLLTGLFCIGAQINRESIMLLTLKPILLASIIWAIIIPTSLLLVLRV